MRIAIILGSLSTGGTEIQFSRLAKELKAQGHDVHLIILKKLFVNPTNFYKDLPKTSFLDFNNKVYSLSNFKKLINFIRILRESKPEFIISALPNTILFALNLAEIFSRRSVRIAAIRGINLQQNFLLSRVYARTLRRAKVVVTNAPHLRDRSIRQFNLSSKSVKVISNGVDIPDFQIRTKWPPTTCITVANFLNYKGHDVLLRAIPQLDQPLNFIFCGIGLEQKKLENLTRKLGVADQVSFVNNANIPLLLQQADFMIHPSSTEGLSNAILEGLAHGLPVIACNIPGNTFVIEHNKNGILVEKNCPTCLADAINKLNSDEVTFREIRNNAYKSSHKFSWERCTSYYIDMLNSVNS